MSSLCSPASGWPDVRVSLVDGRLVIITHPNADPMIALHVITLTKVGSISIDASGGPSLI